MMLVGDVQGRTTILIDDLADTCTTISRAARLLKRQGATKVYALVTHGIFSGEAMDRLRSKDLDKIVVTNSVDQREHKELLGDKLDVLEVGQIFSEVKPTLQLFKRLLIF
jgi:ribose-phosphate pyrophosphokinase